LQHDLLPRSTELGRRHRHSREERTGVRVLRLAVELSARRNFDDVAEIHDEDPVRDVADHVQVVGDEDVCEPELLLEVLEQVEDLRLHGDIERRDRLVAHDQLRVDSERTRDADALSLTTRELMRETVVVLGIDDGDYEHLLYTAL